ncbi:sulfotransferase family 2 domain-containing protein [Profundibacter sp.]
MIIIERSEFAFVHIPKCAGTTVRNWLTAQTDHDRRFDDYLEVPGVGRYHGAHLTLDVLRDAFPEELAKLRDYWSCTAVRDPFARFSSAFSQYEREFHGRNVQLMTADALQADLSELVMRLKQGEAKKDTTLMHFLPQSDFIYLDGEKIVNDIIPIERMDVLIERISRHLGISPPEKNVANERRQSKVPMLKSTLHRAKKLSRLILPKPIWRKLHNTAISLLTKKNEDQLDIRALGIESFIAEHYAQDTEIHRKALSDISSR